MAANLIYLKSRSLLPRDQQPPEEDAAEDDPRWELIRQLIEYKKFKEAAAELNLRALEQERIFIREAGSDRKSTRLNSSHSQISYAVFCLKKTDGNDRVGEFVANGDLAQTRQVDEAGRAHVVAVRIDRPVRDQIEADLALGALDSGVGLAL